MKKKWASPKVKQLEKWLRMRWPDIFSPGPDLKPLSLDVHKQILEFRSENENLSGRVLQEALKRHTGSFGYLYGMLKNTYRHDLDGEQAEPLLAEHKEWARSTLRARQKLAQKARKAAGNKRLSGQKAVRRGSAPPVSAGQRTSQQVEKSAGPVIRYKQPRRRIQALRKEPSVELALGGS